MLACIGIAYANALGLTALVLLPLIGILVRIYVEERTLTSALGEEYLRYTIRLTDSHRSSGSRSHPGVARGERRDARSMCELAGAGRQL